MLNTDRKSEPQSSQNPDIEIEDDLASQSFYGARTDLNTAYAGAQVTALHVELITTGTPRSEWLEGFVISGESTLMSATDQEALGRATADSLVEGLGPRAEELRKAIGDIYAYSARSTGATTQTEMDGIGEPGPSTLPDQDFTIAEPLGEAIEPTQLLEPEALREQQPDQLSPGLEKRPDLNEILAAVQDFGARYAPQESLTEQKLRA